MNIQGGLRRRHERSKDEERRDGKMKRNEERKSGEQKNEMKKKGKKKEVKKGERKEKRRWNRMSAGQMDVEESVFLTQSVEEGQRMN